MPVALVLDVQFRVSRHQKLFLCEFKQIHVFFEFEVLGDFVDDVVDLECLSGLLYDMKCVVVD